MQGTGCVVCPPLDCLIAACFRVLIEPSDSVRLFHYNYKHQLLFSVPSRDYCSFSPATDVSVSGSCVDRCNSQLRERVVMSCSNNCESPTGKCFVFAGGASCTAKRNSKAIAARHQVVTSENFKRFASPIPQPHVVCYPDPFRRRRS